MTRKQAVKKLFQQSLTEAMFGKDLAQANRILARRREAARAKRTK